MLLNCTQPLNATLSDLLFLLLGLLILIFKNKNLLPVDDVSAGGQNLPVKGGSKPASV